MEPASRALIQVSIGRIEICARREPPAPPKPRRPQSYRPAMTLDDYLRKRGGRG